MINVTVSPDRLHTHVRMLAETFCPRNYTHTENLDRTAVYVRNEFEQARGMVSEQLFEMEGKTYRNVIATFGPDTGERIVVGAHYDACGDLPGADDNASGVAGLIELAYLLGRSNLRIRLDLVAYTLEEPKLLDAGGDGLFRTVGGSAVHAESLRVQGAAVRLMLSLEMIGYFSEEPGSQTYPSPIFRLLYPSPGNFALVVGRLQDFWLARKITRLMRTASPLPVYSLSAPAWLKGVDWSDHYNYWKRNYPALMITDTAFNRNREYHKSGDTADRLDYKRMALVVEGVYAAVRHIAENNSKGADVGNDAK
jgi:Zn-dependent M28 family amino/carboxypeptidase